MGENKKLVCEITSGFDSLNGQYYDVSHYPKHIWTLDLENEVVIGQGGNRYESTFGKDRIKWGFCFTQQGSCQSYDKGAKLPDNIWVGDIVIISGQIYFLDRISENEDKLSYQHCIHERAFSCKFREKGFCKVGKKIF